MNLYDNIKKLRIENGWSQDELAKKTGYTSRSTIARIEAGEIDLPQSKIMAFARVFGVNPVDLMGLEDKEVLSNELLALFDQLTPEKQQAVLDFLRSLLR